MTVKGMPRSKDLAEVQGLKDTAACVFLVFWKKTQCLTPEKECMIWTNISDVENIARSECEPHEVERRQ